MGNPAFHTQKSIKRAKRARANNNGFTIVELLIVIIVIGILATLILVAYSNFADQAKAATAKNDLEQITKQLNLYKENLGGGVSYPADMSSVSYSSGSTVQYSVNNTTIPATYCVTVTNGTKSFFANNSAQAPVSGGCPGHGVGGQPAVTNYVTNPSLETSVSGFSMSFGTIGVGLMYQDTTLAYSGTDSMKMVWTTASISGPAFAAPPNTLSPSQTYTFSAYIRSSRATTVMPTARFYSGANGTGTNTDLNGTAVAIPANTWTRISTTQDAPSTTQSGLLRVALSNAMGIGDSINADAFMITQGPTLTNYADGSTANWVWNGAAHGATSTGPTP